ncbi:MAG: ABC transporter ATP-binding protein [Eubacteriales bacterium]|nr:ABC transporter ATP-binding protein [Eubacteriales bacterium]
MPEIILTDVTKRWGNFYAVEHLDLKIEDNAFVTLLGPSGCGKTTTLRMIAGLETPTSGRITIGDKVVFDSEEGINVPANKRKVGFLFQNYALWPNMTVYQNISFGLENKKCYSKEEIKEIVYRVARIVKVEMFLDRYPAELSGGQQQRVAIARTLAPEPKVIFMDEPLSNLDAKLRLEMRSELQRLHLATGCTFVYVTHDQMEAMTLATKICLIDNGVLQQYAAPLTVYGKPANTFVADFVGNPQINFIEAEGEQNGAGVDLSILDKSVSARFESEGLDLAEWRAADIALEEAKENIRAERALDKKYVEKGNKDVRFKCRIARVEEPESEEDAPATERDFIIGVRPEAIKISDGGSLEGEIYSAMPTGMETTVRIRVGNLLLTGVIFGGITYGIGQTVHFDITGDDIMLFSGETGRLISTGTLEIR